VSSEKEIVIEKVGKIYQNYGIDTDDLSDEDLITVYNWYLKNLDSLESDLQESERQRVDDGSLNR
tara:strand:- start:2534 stop:2728 length:195 start_codon:yes stop_codon:yes gene_type:complete